MGGRTYEAVRAASGGSKYVSRGAAAVASLVTGPFGATPVRALYVRSDYIKGVTNTAKDKAKNTIDTVSKGAKNTGANAFAPLYEMKEEGRRRANS